MDNGTSTNNIDTSTSNTSNTPSLNQTDVTHSDSSQSAKASSMVLVLLTVVISALVFGLGGYFLGQQSSNSLTDTDTDTADQPTLSASPQGAVVVSPSPSVSENNTYSNQYFTFTYPNSWQADGTIIYEARSNCDSDTSRCAYEKNIVDIRSNLTAIYQGYTNPEWFNKISTLTSPLESDAEVFSKMASGQTADGNQYVIFKQAPTANYQGEPVTFIIGYVLDGNNLYELRLSDFGTDQDGLQTLQSLTETVTVK